MGSDIYCKRIILAATLGAKLREQTWGYIGNRLRDTRRGNRDQVGDAGGWDRAVVVKVVRKGRCWKYFESKASGISGRTGRTAWL